jgi:CubicO group peptidase (beta-lactamase class C family)
MSPSLFRILSAPMDLAVRLAATACGRRKVPRLRVSRSSAMEHRMEALAGWLDRLHSRGVFNGTVLIAERGEIRFERHYGFADAVGTIPLSGHSSFSLASVSKQFTGMGIVLLAQKGKLALNDRLTRHIPELADYSGITVRQLMHHTSGVPDYMELADEHWDSERVFTTGDLIALLVKHRPPLNFAPGDRFEYSNTGYVLLGEIIARVSGMSYAEFMSREIFEPLGMRDSAAFNLASPACTLRCRVFGLRKRFVCFGKTLPCDLNYLDGAIGDGGIYASAEDLVRWDAALRDGKLIPCERYQEAYVSGKLNDGDTTGYGFGWEIDAPDVVEHWGEWVGFTSYLRRDLKKQTLLVVLSNLGPSSCVDAISAELGMLVEDM